MAHHPDVEDGPQESGVWQIGGRLVVAGFISILALTLGFGSPAGAHYQTAEGWKWSGVFGVCIQTKVAHGEVSGGLVVQARTWSRVYNGNCNTKMNRAPNQLFARMRPTRVSPAGVEVECGYTLSGWNTVTTNNYGVSLIVSAASWEGYYCPGPDNWRLAGVSDGEMVILPGANIDVWLYPGTNGWANAHPI